MHACRSTLEDPTHLTRTDLGIGTPGDRLFAASLVFPANDGPITATDAFWPEAVRQLRTIAGVTSVSVSSGLIGGSFGPFSVPGGPALPDPPRALVQFSDETLPDTLGLHVTMGRWLAAAEVSGARRAALVNETMVRQHFGGGPAVGRTIHLDRLAAAPFSLGDPTFEIVGVVRDVANAGPRDPPVPHVFVPYTLAGPFGLGVLVKTAGDDAALLTTAVRQRVQAIKPQVAIVNPRTAAALLDQGLYAQPRFSLMVILLFAGTGLGLVALGVYGVISYAVSQQTREFAIRMALGGERRHVLGQVLAMTVRLVGVGIVVGLGGGVATGQFLTAQAQLWRTAPHDPVTFASAVGVVVLIGAAACAAPARRATKVHPAVALRQE